MRCSDYWAPRLSAFEEESVPLVGLTADFVTYDFAK
jgi:hypothetical protein